MSDIGQDYVSHKATRLLEIGFEVYRSAGSLLLEHL